MKFDVVIHDFLCIIFPLLSVNKGGIYSRLFLIALLMPGCFMAGVVIIGSHFHSVPVVHLSGTTMFITESGVEVSLLFCPKIDYVESGE